ncbi:MAG: toxin-antitoxin system [Rhodospirillales bacterium]|nr:toxin-antitoxin system [Rhodospirillales bacterium]
MAQLIVRKLEDSVKALLTRRARRHGRSLEAEVRAILRVAARDDDGPPVRLGSRIAGRFAGKGLGTEIEELRGQRVRPPRLR